MKLHPFSIALISALACSCSPTETPATPTSTANGNPPPEVIQQKMAALLEKFDRFDDDGDGKLTMAELKVGVDAVGTMLIRPDRYALVMKAYDTNHDHRISLEEAQQACQKGPSIFSQS